MSNIIKFPKRQIEAEPEKVANTKGKAVHASLIRFIWVATVLVWPVLRWVLSIEVFFQFIRMIYLWNTSGVHAGWTFLFHFAALTALTYFVSLYKPKGI